MSGNEQGLNGRAASPGEREDGAGAVPARPAGRRARLMPPPIAWVVVVLAAVAIVILHTTDLTRDHSVANCATLVMAFIPFMFLLIWFTWFSGHRRWLRRGVLVGVPLLAGLAAALLRIDRVTGELIPAFSFRFTARPDQVMGTVLTGGPGTASLAAPDLRTTTPIDFPQFLGPRRDVAVEGIRLARDWAAQPPEVRWRRKIGAGWSSFAVVNGYAVTQEQRGDQEMVTCYRVASGEPVWVYAISARYETTLGGIGPRCTPTIHEGRVYSLGALGHLACLDGSTGQPIWKREILRDCGMTLDEERRYLPYGRSASPLIAGDLVIVTGGGPPNGRKISLLAYDKGTGAPVWQGGESQISCCSPAFAALAGADQVLVVNENSASGHDLRTGRVLWETEWPGRSNADASVSQVVPVPPDCVFLSKGYGVGAALFQLVPAEDGRFSLKELWRNRNVLRTKFTNVTLRDGYVYGLSDGILECVELKTGRCVWHDGRYLHGQILRVEDLLLVLSERGDLFLVEATPERPNHVLGRLPALRGKTWNTMALYGPDLLARNAEEAVCVRVPLMLPAMGEERTRGTLQNPE